ncbi:MAG: transcriptional repressor [Halanaerobium sp.]|nr:transcriptional repressor [Halanaerobium sp.]
MKNNKTFRMTKQRKTILEVLRNTTSHPTADEIYEKVRRKIPNISLGTVYRNLKILKEMGEILELEFGSSFSRFDGNPINHYHFQCQECGRVYDIDLPVQEGLNAKVEELSGNKVYNHRMEFYGICRECRS